MKTQEGWTQWHITHFYGLFSKEISPLVMGKSDIFPVSWLHLVPVKVSASYSTFNEKVLDGCCRAHISRQQLFVETLALAVLPTLDFNYGGNNPYFTVNMVC